MAHSPRGCDWEWQLRARLLAGEEAALTELYDRYGALVFGVAARLVRDPASAEDVSQEVFAHVWSRPAAFDPGCGTLRGWLTTLAHRRAVDAVRRAVREQRCAVAHGGLSPSPPDPADCAVAAAVASGVWSAVDALPATQRTPILLAYAGGLTARQIAERLGIPEGTVKSRLRLGLRRLARLLAAGGFTDER